MFTVESFMRRRTRFFALAAAAVLALGVYAGRPIAAQRPGGPARNAGALEAAIAEIEAGRKTTPLVEASGTDGEATVTFLAQRDGGRVPRIVSDVTGWGEHVDGTFDFSAGTMTRVGRTNWYSLQANVAPRARIEYLIAYAPTDYRIDPHNPRQSAGPRVGGAQASEFVTPGYVAPQEFADPPVSPAGLVTEHTVESRVLSGSCRVIVYMPPGYRAAGNYPIVVVLSMRSGPVSRVLDWLIAHQAIEPIVAVFVAPEPRGHDERALAMLRTFLTDELLIWVSSRYGVTTSAGRRAIVGISFGAKDAVDAALSSGAFDRLGLLIPGRRIGRADIDAIAARRNRRLHVAVLAGQYDHANVATARSLRDALSDAGHAVDYTEVPEGHSPVTWTRHLRVVLVALFGRAE